MLAAQYTLSHTRLKKRHNITDERAALYEEARPTMLWCCGFALTRSAQVGKWTTALGARNFMGGDRPNLAGAACRNFQAHSIT